MAKTNNGKNGGLLVGNPHSKGGIKAVVTDDGNRPVELEGKEAIVNKRSMEDTTVYIVKGTPRQIVSAMNSLDGNGVVIENGAHLTDTSTGETKTMGKGGWVTTETYEYLPFLNWWK